MSFFEKKIQDQRSELDDIESFDSQKIWQGIEQELHPPKSFSFSKGKALLIAFLILSLGLLIGYFLQPAEPIAPSAPRASIPQELQEQEASYNQVIQAKMQELDFKQLDKEKFKDIFLELDLLEQIHQEYKADIPEYGYQDELVKTLIKYYERKIRILEILSKEIEKREHHDERSKRNTI